MIAHEKRKWRVRNIKRRKFIGRNGVSLPLSIFLRPRENTLELSRRFQSLDIRVSFSVIYAREYFSQELQPSKYIYLVY